MVRKKTGNLGKLPAPESYVERDYRSLAEGKGLCSTLVRVSETDLHVFADYDVGKSVKELVVQYRLQLDRYNQKVPEFFSSLVPLEVDPVAPPLVRDMLDAAVSAGVGPMAAVAGAIAGHVGESLRREGCKEVMVENGGDLYLDRKSDSTVAIFAGQSPLSYNIGIQIKRDGMPCGVCTSSGTVGHSLSFGDADSVTVVADSIALADAAATRVGNEVGKSKGSKDGVTRGLKMAELIEGIRGVVIICNEVMGASGDIELVKL